MMSIKEIEKNLEEKNYDAFGEDLQLEVQMCAEYIDYSSKVENLVDHYGIHTIVNFLCEDFPDRYGDEE